MKLIIGLGNPGAKYTNTRHSIGFMVADALARKFSTFNFQFSVDKNLKSETLKIKVTDNDVILAKPQTFMNAAGFAVKKLADFYHIDLAKIWVIHDDLDLPLGKIKIRNGGGTAGHHGLESIAQQLGTLDFIRFRLGVGRPTGHDKWEKLNVKRREIEKYVLSEFTLKEGKEAAQMIKKASEAVQVALKKGLESAMNQFNQ